MASKRTVEQRIRASCRGCHQGTTFTVTPSARSATPPETPLRRHTPPAAERASEARAPGPRSRVLEYKGREGSELVGEQLARKIDPAIAYLFWPIVDAEVNPIGIAKLRRITSKDNPSRMRSEVEHHRPRTLHRSDHSRVVCSIGSEDRLKSNRKPPLELLRHLGWKFHLDAADVLGLDCHAGCANHALGEILKCGVTQSLYRRKLQIGNAGFLLELEMQRTPKGLTGRRTQRAALRRRRNRVRLRSTRYVCNPRSKLSLGPLGRLLLQAEVPARIEGSIPTTSARVAAADAP